MGLAQGPRATAQLTNLTPLQLSEQTTVTGTLDAHLGIRVAAVVDRERTKIGVYILLEPHTEPMEREPAGGGLYDGSTGKVPKIQLFTIEEFVRGPEAANSVD